MESLLETLRELSHSLQETIQTFEAMSSQITDEDFTSCVRIANQSSIKSTVKALRDIANKYTTYQKVITLKEYRNFIIWNIPKSINYELLQYLRSPWPSAGWHKHSRNSGTWRPWLWDLAQKPGLNLQWGITRKLLNMPDPNWSFCDGRVHLSPFESKSPDQSSGFPKCQTLIWIL